MLSLMVLQGFRTIQLANGRNALIDDADYDRVRGVSWYADAPKGVFYVRGKEYLGRRDGESVFRKHRLHRLIMDAPDGMVVDHRDGDTLNNTRANLRLATGGQNNQNRRTIKSELGVKGVTRFKTRYRAEITHEGRKIKIGYFGTIEEAAAAYDNKARELFGDFAATNAMLLSERFH